MLVLEKWWTVVQKIYIDKDDHSVQRFEVYRRNGTLLYRGEITETQMIQEYRVPYRVQMSNDNGIVFQLHIERYIPDVPVVPEMFNLKPPDTATP